jgi:hypothetical protein
VHKARLLIIGTTTVLAVGLGAAPAVAAPTDTTTQTFELLAGTLDVEAPATADTGSGSPGGSVSGQLGSTTVTDGRASADASWTSTVASANFQTGAGLPSETILATEVDYWSGPAIATTGDGTFTPGQVNAAAAEALDNVDPLIAFTHTGGTGNNTASWNPTVVINVPLNGQAGVYTGTVTHSVA